MKQVRWTAALVVVVVATAGGSNAYASCDTLANCAVEQTQQQAAAAESTAQATAQQAEDTAVGTVDQVQQDAEQAPQEVQQQAADLLNQLETLLGPVGQQLQSVLGQAQGLAQGALDEAQTELSKAADQVSATVTQIQATADAEKTAAAEALAQNTARAFNDAYWTTGKDVIVCVVQGRVPGGSTYSWRGAATCSSAGPEGPGAKADPAATARLDFDEFPSGVSCGINLDGGSLAMTSHYARNFEMWDRIVGTSAEQPVYYFGPWNDGHTPTGATDPGPRVESVIDYLAAKRVTNPSATVKNPCDGDYFFDGVLVFLSSAP